MIHTVFDILAWAGGAAAGLGLRRVRPELAGGLRLGARPWYFAAAALGGLAGAVALGSANTQLAGGGKSVLGGILGAILAVELYKYLAGLRGSTGLAFVAPLAAAIDSIAIAYGLRDGATLVPVTGFLPREVLLSAVPNSLTFDAIPGLKEKAMAVLSMAAAGEATAQCLGQLLCCLPKMSVPDSLTYDRVFRVAIVQFLDRFSFDLGAVKRSCVHVAVPGRMMPLDTWNMFHRRGTV